MDPLIAGTAAAGLIWLLTRRKSVKRRTVQPQEPGRPVDIDPVVDPVVEPVDPGDDARRLAAIYELLRSFISDTPKPGYFYLIRTGDNLLDIARTALDTVGPYDSPQALLDYIYCLSSSPNWNMRLYGTPSTTKVFPKEYLVPHISTGVRVAFLPRNEDAVDALVRGFMPRMAVDSVTGAPRGMGNNYGLLWLPPVDPEVLAGGEPTCAPSPWDDGSSTIDPPPQLLDLLEAA